MRQDLPRLLERERETEVATSALLRTRAGEGGVVLFEGERGSGKTSLLRLLRDDAQTMGFQVLHARGGELEQGFSWAIVRQLFERTPAEPSGGVPDPFGGPAALARSLFDYDQEAGGLAPAPEEEAPELHAVLHGLYWLCRNLSRHQPLVLVVDDVHWADRMALRFLSYLVNRIDTDAVLVLLAGEPTTGSAAQDLLMSVVAAPSAGFATLGPLSVGAVRETAARILGGEVDESFAEACHSATAGNPRHLHELLADVADRGIEPVAAAATQVGALAPSRVAWEIRRRVRRLPDAATVLAGAIAVLDTAAEPRHVCPVSGLDEAVAAAAAGLLRDAKLLLPGVPYTFQRPIVRQVIYDALPAQERNTAHRRSARLLWSAGAPRSAADHLCKTDPDADAWAVDLLRAAAEEAVRNGDPRAATRYLIRAMAEAPGEAVSDQIMAQLGAAELRARDRSAVSHLFEALRRAPQHGLQRSVRLDLAQALAATDRYDEAVVMAGGAWRTGERADDPAVVQARTLTSALARLSTGRGCRRQASAPPSRDIAPDRAHAAAEALCRGVPSIRVARLASGAIAEGIHLTPQDLEFQSASLAAWTLAQCDDFAGAERGLTDILRQADDRGHVLAAMAARGLRATVLFDTGRLATAESEARVVLRHHDSASLTVWGSLIAASTLVQCLIETGRPAEAEAVLERYGLAAELPESALYGLVRVARGRLMVSLERFEEGARDLLECRRLAGEKGWQHPAATAGYLTDAVRALTVTEGSRAARKLAFEEVVRASSFGAGRPLAVALRTYGELVGGRKGLSRIESAEELLCGLPNTLEWARTLVALGSALRRMGSRTEARQRLTAGMELGGRFGATGIVESARAELRLAGARLTQTAEGTAPLTPAEQRVAAKAAEGLSNREIAQRLFITVKTVEWHLRQTYTKLGISKRSELVRALAKVPAMVPRSA
ncbi:ATP-binding protein [Kitasatospora sp. NPDC091207]|uniref:ATP-binding protein n=1 Tax=Kitasatospora sp. NPDC091207 TaxID=3364083 RepID=UPI0038035828